MWMTHGHIIRWLFLVGALLLVVFATHAKDQGAQDADSLPAIKIIPGVGNDRYPNWSPNGKQIVFESDRYGHWDVFLLDIETEEVTRLTHSGSDERYPSWDDTGTAILYVVNHQQLQRLSLSNLEAQSIPTPKQFDEILFAHYAPDGKGVAFTARMADQLQVYLMSLENRELKSLTPNDMRAVYPSWSKDSQRLVFFSRRDTDGEADEIYTLNLNSKHTKRITHWPTHNFAPSFSPDQNYIACATSVENSRPELTIINSKTGAMQWLTNDTTGDVEPAWSPDGQQIAWARYTEGNYDIAIINLDSYLFSE